MEYNPALDGLRAFAVAMVVAVHCRVPGFVGGYIGVELFFVLSGYLITSILLAEHSASGRISLGRFYWRRALRLYPALLLMLAVYMALAPLAWPGKPHGRDSLIAGLYLSDYAYTLWKIPKYLSHTWTLAAEEHFYLLWPPLLILMLRRWSPDRLAWPIAGLVLAAWLWQMHARNTGGIGFRFDTRMVGMMAGCWLAVAMRNGWRISPRVAGGCGAALLAVLVVIPSRSWFPFAELAGVLLILGASALPLAHPWLAGIGKLSYGIYLWHFPLALWLNPMPMSWPLTLLTVSAVSIFVAWVSYVTVEAVGRRMKARLSSSALPDDSLIARATERA